MEGKGLKCATRVSRQQREVMIKFMCAHRDLAHNKLVGPTGGQRKEKLWRELSQELNSCPSGATKDVGKWTKCWQDWKCDVKQKAAKLRRHSLGSGGGPPLPLTPLSNLEKRLLGLLGEVAVIGAEGEVDPIELQLENEEVSLSDGSSSFDEDTSDFPPPPRKRKCLEKGDGSSLEERNTVASEKLAEAAASIAMELSDMSQIMREILKELRKFRR
ncbi:myb/SANT-like DNA-binding domain-containing protein 3 isoform X2 [Ischnura elegans]|uniref:myb/SANT-like DNA-binding domain-containing protein 3 isoform X2 n=1 Tax=Ischnura elegans TaxID=197161 RepID=UPI001ED8B7BC|nr:myb/SANT-like DNA-binding domain-containing protein 3 isoform X2 [Ischnura elegans]